ncbi:MAG: endonuclease domain-containing protein, partial [Acidimicrobiales bacterium]
AGHTRAMRLENAAVELSERQHGVVAAWQLRALGATTTEVDRLRRAAPRWAAATPRVLVRGGCPATDDRLLMTAVLDASPGAVVSLTSAAAIWDAPGFRIEPIHVVRHRGISRRPSSLATVHEVVDLMPQHIKLVRRIPVISPARTVCELAAVVHRDRVERVLDRFWNRGLLDGVTFDRTVRELAARGRTGSTLLRELNDARGPGYRPPDSGQERRFEQILVRHGERPMRRQIDVGGEEWTGRVDYVDDELPLIAEVQSEQHHTSLVDRASDERRLAALRAAGFHVLEIWDTDLWHEPDSVAETVRLARHQLRVLRQ